MSKDTVFQTQTLGVAIIGSGLMAKAHTMAWRNVQAVYGDVPVMPRLVILCDATDEIAAAGAAQFGYERWTTSWREAIDDPDVDVVDIVTPNFLHKDIAIAAAKAGKHIWCEKPLALTAEDALEMTQAAEEADILESPSDAKAADVERFHSRDGARLVGTSDLVCTQGDNPLPAGW